MHFRKGPIPLFEGDGRLASVFRVDLAPTGDHRMSANPHSNGGCLKKALTLARSRDFAANVDKPGRAQVENNRPLGFFLAEVMKRNANNFRVFGPDETSSNKLDGLYKVTKKSSGSRSDFPKMTTAAISRPTAELNMEMLSEHTMEGMLEGYLLTGRHGFLSTYESFVHVIDSMFNQHAKWLEICNHLTWRQAIASLNLLITSTVWRQDRQWLHPSGSWLPLMLW